MRLVIVGKGKMGRAIAALAEERGHEVAALIGREENDRGGALMPERLSGVDAALEFTSPPSAAENVRRLIDAGVPTVCGTTGWDAAQEDIAHLVKARRGALLYAANFSVGVQLFLRAARELGRQLAGHDDFEASISEEHHAAKRDAPSGTALVLQKRLREVDPARDFPITSVREGATPGIHTIGYDGRFERIALTHVARSREGFAAGALAAAEWLPGRVGVFGIEDMLFGGSG